MISQPQSVADLQHNLELVRERIAATCERSGRDPQDVRLLPVSKTVSEEVLRNAVAAGVVMFGENKVQEVVRKSENLADTGVKWAVIGHLQTNKAKYVAELASEFQALDSVKVAAALHKRLQLAGRELDVFVQVNTSGEASKFGADPAAVPALLEQLAGYASLRVRGFMTMAANTDNSAEVAACFARLRGIRDSAVRDFGENVCGAELSMGMSGDFELAIAEGSTCVRVGSSIFGSRN
ncbi:YggS family pyridoxal phosphate-dependent enzyme [Canibacter sp. lx-45]|uniref:YggS family pyridoxal phosphate-dependent enzyme n=1 Tax=Canibacter zhuwentaonis TaxID=2837491 RepID=UPI001BDCF68D|nr:YggS family pyridoxal phosphate-dependent enzyme [Canibacter zhuwentaonis]